MCQSYDSFGDREYFNFGFAELQKEISENLQLGLISAFSILVILRDFRPNSEKILIYEKSSLV